MRIVREQVGRRTVIVISHDWDLARFADRVLVLADGEVRAIHTQAGAGVDLPAGVTTAPLA